MSVKREKVDQKRLFAVISELAEQGYEDFTFTGGEPLLNWRLIEACLDHMQSIDYLPEVTIVTNGERLNARMIARLKAYPGILRFNFSLHSLIEQDYLQIVHRKVKPSHSNEQLLNHTKQKIALIANAGIPFKLNIVLLKGLNTELAQLFAILNYAEQMGAMSVKFLELLITEPLKQYYPYFYRLSAVKNVLEKELTLLWQNQRKDVYQYKNSKLEVELQHCPCARGCNTCLLNRGVTLSSTGTFYSCFLHPNQSMQLDGTNLSEAVSFGDDFIDKMAKIYGDNSPIIIKDAAHSKEEMAYYYDLPFEQLSRTQALLNGQLIRIREFTEQYLTHAEDADNEYRKISHNSYEIDVLDVHQMVSYDAITKRLRTEFLHQGFKINDKMAHLTYLQQKGYQLSSLLDWKIQYYQSKEQHYSISKNEQTGRYFLRTEQPFDELTLNLKPLIQIPFELVIQQLCNDEPQPA